MVSRMTLILWILQSKHVVYLYEQPMTSLLFFHPRMEQFIRANNAWRVFTWMAGFGAASPKGTVLWSSRPAVKFLSRNLPCSTWSTEMTVKTTSADGKTSVSGGADLKKSQEYTEEFGMSTVDFWKMCGTCCHPDLSQVEVPNVWGHISKSKDRWDDANLTEVMQYLTLS